jgi:hypothetical protein
MWFVLASVLVVSEGMLSWKTSNLTGWTAGVLEKPELAQ